MKELVKNILMILTALITALLLFLFSNYFSSFVSHAQFNKFKIEDQRTKTEISTKLETIIKNLDKVKDHLNVI